MRPQLANPPVSITQLARASDTPTRRGSFRLIRGKVLPLPPRHARTLDGLLPYSLGATLEGPQPVAARIDVEDRQLERFARPDLERVERGRDFYLTDGTGHALVRFTDSAGRLHDDVELHLDAPFVTREIAATHSRRARTAFVRTLRAGDLVFLWGGMRTEPDDSGLGTAGYRDAPAIAVFAADCGPLHLWDEAAFEQVAAWNALPWYRKLSLLVRNR